MSDEDPSAAGAVLVVGSVNRDTTVRVHRFPAPGETLLGESVTRGLGGKGANQAAAAARTGVAVRLLATVGDDADGEALRADLQRLGVGTGLLATTADSPTGTAHITVDASGQNTIVVVAGANAATTPQRVAAAAGAVRAAGAVVVQAEVPVETVAAVLELAERVGTLSVLNLAPAVDLPVGVLERARVLVVNETEAALVLGSAAPRGVPAALEAAARLARRLPAVVVTLGAAGAVLAEAGGAPVHVPAPPASRVIDTTGAGDAAVGVLAAALARGAGLPGAVADAVSAATRSVEHPGAAASYPRFALSAHRA